ncbi:glycosyltransferase family 2 protein [Rhodopirellula sp. MGV]|uniref:glycosyltransferase family 2 protein n=1 Tax=Rhodopirellula sp. MGV TaxID=2023130 RepID=UPI000B965C11|nr:glycosyltransferase family 2 protein [Rhodopirellula sp. MGV]OYP34094.1 glycosyl transferase family 2 [Rhodopirellula sp. MGV]PNY35607.1 glycosyltransferase family 2 protein [Rhodopirellula baltica]
MSTLDLTIVIPAKNDADRLGICLDAIGHDLASSVVIVDSESSDNTAEVAEAYGAELIQFRWDGMFPKKRNWFLRNHTPATKWVLFLDSDEILTDEFKAELRRTLPQSDCDGYWLRYTIYFLREELKYGYPLRKLALFRVGAGEYERIDEDRWSKLDMEIHEHPVIEGPVGELRSKIDHRDFRDVSHYIAKHNEYSSWEAHRFLRSLEQQTDHGKLTLKQKVKYRLVQSPFAGVVYFFGAYVMMRGFLDGKRGLAFALLKLGYFTQVYCKIRELRGQQPNANPRAAEPVRTAPQAGQPLEVS